MNIETAKFKVNPQYRLQWEEAQNCHVLLYPEGLVQLSDSAAIILQECLQASTMATIIQTLQQRFPDAKGIGDDIKEFLVDASGQGWIVECET
jgi:pyrroloquinoline quinone biosynthesis protein D